MPVEERNTLRRLLNEKQSLRRIAPVLGRSASSLSREVDRTGMDGCGTDAALEALTAKFRRIPLQLRKTLTYDQGKEMARHKELTRRLSIGVFFADHTAPGNDQLTVLHLRIETAEIFIA